MRFSEIYEFIKEIDATFNSLYEIQDFGQEDEKYESKSLSILSMRFCGRFQKYHKDFADHLSILSMRFRGQWETSDISSAS